MERFPDFQPNNDDEEQWIEKYNDISDWISEKIRSLSEERRLPSLRESGPSDLQLMNLYIRAYKKEDYETCFVAKALLMERGYNEFPS